MSPGRVEGSSPVCVLKADPGLLLGQASTAVASLAACSLWLVPALHFLPLSLCLPYKESKATPRIFDWQYPNESSQP